MSNPFRFATFCDATLGGYQLVAIGLLAIVDPIQG